MKKIILGFSFAVLFYTTSFSQKISKDNVPASALDTFKAKFSIAEKAEWEMDYDNYQADFTVGNAIFSATFDKDGKWLKTESYIKASALPKNIRDYVTKNFPGYSTDDAEKVETPEKVTYDMVVTKDDLSYDISLSPDAILLKHEQKGEPKDEPK